MHFHIYRDQVGEYRWRLKAKNGKIIAASAAGYHLAKACRRAITRLQFHSRDAGIMRTGRV